MAIVPSINLVGLASISRAGAGRPGVTTKPSSRPGAGGVARPGAQRPSSGLPGRSPGTPGAGAGTGTARPGVRPGGIMARYRDPNFPDLGPEVGIPEAPRPELTPEERIMREERRRGTERTSGEAIGLGSRFNARPSFAASTLAAQMAARRRGRRPGQPMV